ncbi:divalent-cation tolerance protein CutA [candidate division WOR-3 bacterium]|nr:divalent-cation tolerance protein CutA [candidate division WOR-3 bacterium]
MTKEKYCIVYVTFPKKQVAKDIAKILIREKLIACANIFKIDSLYTWKGKLEEDSEYSTFLKTRKDLYTKIEKRILELHPYECPAIIEIPITDGFSDYLSWIEKETEVDKKSTSALRRR